MKIWPWSVFSRLRYEAQDAREDARIWEKACKSARHQTGKALERADELHSLFEQHRREFIELENIRQSLETARVHQMEANEQHVRDNKALARKLASVEAQLAEATKNDKRDPKTGRFVKGSE